MGPSATLNDYSDDSYEGTPNIDPAGTASKQIAGPSWPMAGVIPDLNNIWLNPGMYLEPGTGFSSPGPSSAVKQFGGGWGFAFPHFNFNFPDYPMPEGGEAGGGEDGGLSWMDILKKAASAASKFKRGGTTPHTADTTLQNPWTPENLDKAIQDFYGTGEPEPMPSLFGSEHGPSWIDDASRNVARYNVGLDTTTFAGASPAVLGALGFPSTLGLSTTLGTGIPQNVLSMPSGLGTTLGLNGTEGAVNEGFNLGVDTTLNTAGSSAASAGSGLAGAGAGIAAAAAAPIAQEIFGHDSGKTVGLLAPWVLAALGYTSPMTAAIGTIAYPIVKKLIEGNQEKRYQRKAMANTMDDLGFSLSSLLYGGPDQAQKLVDTLKQRYGGVTLDAVNQGLKEVTQDERDKYSQLFPNSLEMAQQIADAVRNGDTDLLTKLRDMIPRPEETTRGKQYVNDAQSRWNMDRSAARETGGPVGDYEIGSMGYNSPNLIPPTGGGNGGGGLMSMLPATGDTTMPELLQQADDMMGQLVPYNPFTADGGGR